MSLTYANMPLDRCSNQRKNKRWLTAEFNNQETLFCVINDGMSLFSHENTFKPIYLNKTQLESLSIDSCIYLGKGAQSTESTHISSLFAINYEKLRFSTQEELIKLGQWINLREATSNLTMLDASIQALAKALDYWHTTHQFCGKCGNASRSVEAGHARRCTECRNMSFPRTDPAVIMLVEHMFPDGIARCLLGRQASWKQGIYSTLAGFVDPGETLEEAVIREVSEETGVAVESPQYITSQPWPFPASVMLGFTAVATSNTIDISKDDLEDCQWFSREQLAHFYSVNNVKERNEEKQDKKDEYRIGSGDSISSYLITAWKNKEIGQY